MSEPPARDVKVRAALIRAVALAAGMAAFVLLLHAPFVRRAALGYALTAVQERYGLRLEAARLDYNLAALRVGLAELRLSAPHAVDEPFFEADYLSVTLPARSILGALAFQDIRVANARVRVRRRSDGITNLPTASERADDDPPPLRVERLDVPQLAVELRDEQADISLQIPSVAVRLTPEDGQLALGRSAELRVGPQTTRISELNGQVRFDGRALRFANTQIRVDEASVRLDGRLTLIAREPAVDVHVVGTGDIARLARWGVGDGELPRGTLALEAQITGPMRDPLAQARLTTERLSWQGLVATEISARLRITSEAADVEELQFGFEGGRVTATAALPFASDADGRLAASFAAVNAASATLALAPGVRLVPAGSVSGRVDAQGAMSDPMSWSGSLRADITPGRNVRGRLALSGDIGVQLAEGAWRLEGRQVLAGVAPVTFAARGRYPPAAEASPALQRATIEQGTVTFAQTDLPALLAALRAIGVADVPSDVVAAGTLEADIRLAGSLVDPEVQGRALVRNVKGRQFEMASLEAQVSGRPVELRLDFIIEAPEAGVAGQRLDAVHAMGRLTDVAGPLPPSPRLRRTAEAFREGGRTRPTGTGLLLDELSARQSAGPGVLSGSAAYDLSTGEYTASIDGSEWQLAATADQPLAGRLNIRFTGSGTAEEPRGTGQVTLTDALWQDMRLGNLEASVQLDGQTGHVAARAQDFDATATASVDLEVPYVARIDARAGSLDLARVLRNMERNLATPAPVTGTTSLALRFEGPLDAWRTSSATLEVVSLDATAGDLPIRLAQPARLRYEAERVLVESLEVDAGETRISASGALAALEPARETALGRSVTGGLTPIAPAGLLVTLTGEIGAVARAAAATGLTELPIIDGNGPVALLAHVTGSLQAPIVAADLEVGPGSVTLADLPPVSDLRVKVRAENGWLELREGAASYQDAAISATGRAPIAWITGQPASASAFGFGAASPLQGAANPLQGAASPLQSAAAGDAVIRARATNLTPAILAPFLDATTVEQLSGSVDATLDAASSTFNLADLAGELRIDRLDVRVANLPVTQRVPTRIVARDGFARIEAWDWVGQGATLAVRGQVRLDDRQTAILANGVVDLRMLTPFVREAGMTTAGRLEPRLSITGALDSPRIDGDLTVSGGEIRLVDPRVLVSDLAVRTVLTGAGARITSLTGTVNGGLLTGGGGLEYSPGQRVDVQLSTNIRGMALEFPDGLRSEVDAALDLALDIPFGVATDLVGTNLQVRPPPQAGAVRPPPQTGEVPRPSGRLSGTVTVARGTYREPLAVVTGLLASLRTQSLTASAGPSALLEGLRLDARLLTDEDVIVNNNYGRFQLGADLRVIGTAAVPALSGRAELREGGQLFIGRNVYTVNFGTIDFSNPVTIEPTLNVEASTRAGGEDIEVTITGTAENPTVDLRSTSNPDLGQAEVASLLLTGRRLEDLAPGDAAFVGTQVLGNFSAEVLGFASRAVGLDTIRLGGGENAALRRDLTAVTAELDPTTRLTFGKSLGPDVDVTFSQSLRDGDAQTWIVEYLATRGLELRLVSDDSDLRSYGFRHDVAFGAGSRAIRSEAASRQVQAVRVGEVNVSGDLGIPEARVRTVLRLGRGDRFDFTAWQADRDRIEDVYRREGYLSARITALRSDGADGVTLNYGIAAGPQTRIVVTGMDLTSALRSRLEVTWLQSVFDEFLIDEAAQIVRSELAATGYLQPAVDVQILDETNTSTRADGQTRPSQRGKGGTAKTLAITVERGTHTVRTVVRVEGAEEPLASRIHARLTEGALIEGAASDPGALEREAGAYLRAIGHLRARVTAGAPLFEDSVAVVPLSVDSGPVFTIATLTFEGRRDLSEDLLRATVALAEGMPYDPAAVDAARDRLVALHRLEGFALASVTSRQNVRADAPAIDVAFVIDEGPRQVVGEITVVGNRAIDADVIVRALGLPVRAPLRAEDLLQARTRLFETGLFRRIDVATDPVQSEEVRRAGPVDPSDVVPMRLRVDVEEWPALRLRYGFQVAEERPEASIEGRELVPGLSADVTRRTLFGRAITTGGVVELQRRERLGRVFINTGTLFGLPVGSSLIAERSREEFTAVTLVTDRSRVTWEQRTRVAGNVSLSYAYTFERNHTFDTHPSDPGSLAFDITINIARLNAAAAWDTRDDPVDTTRGSLASFSLEYAPEAVGSDIRFVREVAQAYHFRPWRRLMFASAARVGVVVPLGGQELILSERFFGGGARTVRGVAEGGLGERDFLGDPAGGRMLVVLNQEVRLPVYRWLRGVGFVDAGNVFARPRDASLRNLVGSIGFGLRLATPFALLRADYARPVWGRLESSGRWSVGIGHAF